MNYYDDPKRPDSEVAEVYIDGTGGWPLVMYKINGEVHPFGFMKSVAYVLPGTYAFRYRSDEMGCGDCEDCDGCEGVTITGFVTFNVNLKPGYSYFVTANLTEDGTDKACIFEELRNDPAAVKLGRLTPRQPQPTTKPLQCGTLEWK
jgi:hypothetical protein